MTTRIGINGFGRIGRDLPAVGDRADDIEVVAVNDVADSRDAGPAAALRQHVRSAAARRSRTTATPSSVDGHKIAVTAERDPAQLPWREHGVDVVIESTGKFRTRDDAAAHLAAGARKVLISAPGKGVDATIVLGVNDETYDPREHHVISNASCTTNCVAPMVKVLHDAFGIEHGFMTTVHAYTNDQNVLDGPHKDPRRARAAAVNIIPTTTGAARAVGEVIPAIAGRLDGVALRVPVVDGSLVDLAVAARPRGRPRPRSTRRSRRPPRHGPLAGRLRYTDRPDRLHRRHRRPLVLRLRLEPHPGVRPDGQGLRLVRQRVGLHRRLVDLTRLVAARWPVWRQ